MVDFLYLFKDINFQKGFLLVAVVILLMVILNVAYKLSKEDDGGKLNPIVAPCPDYWDLSGAYCINTSGQNIGHLGGLEHSLWKTTTKMNCNAKQNPYNMGTPVDCNNMKLKTIPIGTMYRGSKTDELIGGGIKNGKRQDIRRRRSKYSRKTWAEKYGLVWDGLNTRW